MKILSAERIRKLDAYTIAEESITSVDLMERAARAFVVWFCQRFENSNPVSIFCGRGNNGGDGLAIARLLSGKAYSVEVFILERGKGASEDFLTNLDRLAGHLSPKSIDSADTVPEISCHSIVIDALIGSGLSRSVSGLMGEVILAVNASSATVVSVDLASGLNTDGANQPDDIIVRPDYTVAFQLPKLSFFLPQNEAFVGEWFTVDIGLSAGFIANEHTNTHYADTVLIESLIRSRPRFSHKGTFGHALLIAGSYGKVGAAFLAGKACLRSGVGLLSISLPNCGYQIMQTSLPEAMVIADGDDRLISQLPDLTPYSAIGVGPGLGKSSETVDVLTHLLSSYSGPLVVDADALNIIAENNALLALLPTGTILTPHPKEFERLAGKSDNHFQRLEQARAFAVRYRVIVCLKGANTAVVLTDGTVYFNSTGNSGMATGGSGDVLTGMITGLLAQGYSPEHAALVGVFKHGKAGDRAAQVRSEASIIASDIIDAIR